MIYPVESISEVFHSLAERDFNAAVALSISEENQEHLARIIEKTNRCARQRVNIFTVQDVRKILKRELRLHFNGKRNRAKMFVDCTFLIAAMRHNLRRVQLLTDVTELLRAYPRFGEPASSGKNRSAGELEKLLAFRNYMAVAVCYIKAKGNMGYLLELCSYLTEGCDRRFITGTGATDATKDRILIYRTEGDVPQKKRRWQDFDDNVMGLLMNMTEVSDGDEQSACNDDGLDINGQLVCLFDEFDTANDLFIW